LSRQDFKAPYKPLIPGYELLGLLGQGAFAEVWEARQARTQKRVALKVFKNKSGAQWLFLQREIERLSQLDKHPYVVSLLDADLSAEPPYYTMDLLPEGSLEKRVDPAAPLSTAQAAQWMEEVAQALAYTHSKGLIHCDLKPANILQDEQGHVRVMDFGHSRILTPSAGGLGTLHYMAPEQTLLAEPGRVFQPDLRWDLFALGTSFHALLSGRMPWAEARPKLESLEHLRDKLRFYRETVAAEPLPDLQRLSHGRVDRDLAAIIARCASADPSQRYASAAEVLDELKARRLERHVSAAAGHPLHDSAKFLHRNRTAVAVAGLCAVIGVGALIRGAHEREQRLRDQSALVYNAQAQGYALGLEPVLAAAYYDAAYQALPSLARFRNLQAYLPAAPRSLLHLGRQDLLGFEPGGERVLARVDKGRLALFALKNGKAERLLAVPPLHLQSGAFSPDGKTLAVGAGDGSVLSVDPGTGEPSGARLSLGQGVEVIAWAPDGKTLAAGGEGAALRVWTWPGRRELSRAPLSGAVERLDFSPDGRWLAVRCAAGGGQSASLQLRSADGRGASLLSLPLSADGSTWAWSPGGPSLLFAESSGRVRAYSRGGFLNTLWSQRALLPAPPQLPRAVALAPGGSHILRLERDGRLGLWQWNGQGFRHLSLDGLPQPVQSAVFDPAGTRLAVLGAQGKLSVWSLSTARRLSGPLDVGRQAAALRWPAAKALLCLSPWGAQAWDPDLGQPNGRALALPAGAELSASPGGAWLLRFPPEAEHEAWAYPNAARRDWVYDFPDLGPGRVSAGIAAVSPDGRRLFSAAGSRGRFWDLEKGQHWGQELRFQRPAHAVSYSPDSRWALVSSEGSQAVLYDLDKGAAALDLPTQARSAAFIDGALVTADPQGQLWRWDLEKGGSPEALGPPWPALQALAAAGSSDLACLGGPELRRVDARKGHLRQRVSLPGLPSHARLGPDASRVLSWEGQSAQLWDASTGRALGRSILLDGPASTALLNPAQDVLAAAFKGGGLRLYDLASGEALGPALTTPGEVKMLSFSADGRSLAAGSANGRHRVWLLPWLLRKARGASAVEQHSQAATALSVDEDGTPQPLAYARWKSLWRASQEEAP
jgi:WD40 repeat protein